MRCLILGGGGFIGKNLSKYLCSLGYEVRVLDKNPSSNIFDEGNIEYFVGDFGDLALLNQAIDRCDVVIHLISDSLPLTSNESPILDIKNNLLLTIGLLELIKVKNIKKFIFVSSGGTVYGIPQYIPVDENHPTNPICSYGIVKLAIEKYLYLFSINSNLNYNVMRLSNVYGLGQNTSRPNGVVSIFLEKNLCDSEVHVYGSGNTVRDFIHVSDVVVAAAKLICYNGNERTFNIGSGSGHTIEYLIACIESITQKKMKVRYSSARSFDVPEIILNVELAKSHLDWKPRVALKDGLSMY